MFENIKLTQIKKDLRNNITTKEQVEYLINYINNQNDLIAQIKIELIKLISLPEIEKILNIIRKYKND